MDIRETLFGFPERLFGKFRKPGNSVVGVDIGPSSIKVVQLRKEKGRAILETYGELALGPYAGLDVGQATSLPAEKIAEALHDVIQEANVTSKNSAFSIPLAASLTTVMSLPAIPERELKSMVPIEARKYIPIPVSETSLDWWIIPKRERDTLEIEREVSGRAEEEHDDDSKRLDILLVAIHNTVIEKYQRVASVVGFDIGFFEIETFSAIRSLLPLGLGTTLILDIGASATNVAIVENGVVYRSHVINRGSQDITIALSRALGISVLKAEEMKREWGLTGTDGENKVAQTAQLIMEGIFGEANRVLLDYEKKEHKTIGKVILSGGGSLLGGAISLAKQNLDTDVVLGDPFSKVETPAFLEEVLKKIGPSFSVAIGLALRKIQEIE